MHADQVGLHLNLRPNLSYKKHRHYLLNIQQHTTHSVCFDRARTLKLNTWKTIVMDTICKKCTDTDTDSSLWIRIRYGFKKLISAHLWVWSVVYTAVLGIQSCVWMCVDYYFMIHDPWSKTCNLLWNKWASVANIVFSDKQQVLFDGVRQEFIQTPTGGYNPRFLCNTHSPITYSKGIIGGCKPIKPIIEKKLQWIDIQYRIKHYLQCLNQTEFNRDLILPCATPWLILPCATAWFLLTLPWYQILGKTLVSGLLVPFRLLMPLTILNMHGLAMVDYGTNSLFTLYVDRS